MHAQTDSYIGYSMDFPNIEQEYKDKKMHRQMQAVAAHVYGREYRFDDPAYADLEPEMLGAIQERQSYNLAQQAVKLLPPRQGREKKIACDMDEPTKIEEQNTFNHYMASN